MAEIVTEALLEMHFQSAIVDAFSSLYGARFLKLLKPSQRQEAWVGFDQGWARTTLSTGELFDDLRTNVLGGTLPKMLFGIFFQFKTVSEVSRGSRLMPRSYSTPYLRSELSLKPNPTTGISQHETLLRLSRIPNACVWYACGMLFDLDDIWTPPNLAQLRCIDITSAPAGWATNQRHFITFQNPTDPAPLWCSEPVEAKSRSFSEWLAGKESHSPAPISGGALIDLISTTSAVIRKDGKFMPPANYAPIGKQEYIAPVLPPSFTILEFEGKPLTNG